MNSNSERPVKRQRTMNFHDFENQTMKDGRESTYIGWNNTSISSRRMIKAGFVYCNKTDRVICLYCGILCHRWNGDVDDPCQVHQLLSPDCVFVRSMSCCHSSQYNRINSMLPHHCNYASPENRLKSFSNWTKIEFPPIKQLVDAGFFHKDQTIVCFYCDGSLSKWENVHHPIAEHTRRFPLCNYARQLCGEEIFHRIQRLEDDREDDFNIRSRRRRRSLGESDPDVLVQLANDRLDLPVSIRVMELGGFDRSIVRQCWIDQIRLKNEDSVDAIHLHTACQVLAKEREIIGNDQGKIYVPSIELASIYAQRPTAVLDGNQNVLTAFADLHQTCSTDRTRLGRSFIEQRNVMIERENSLAHWSYMKPSARDMNNAGWIVPDLESNTSQCPHCHMQYSKWKEGDDPRMIHRHLAPLCPFVLAENPFSSCLIPQNSSANVYTDDVIRHANTQPYDGIVQTMVHPHSLVTNRRNSFAVLPRIYSIDANELVNQGFYYEPSSNCIKCFYCPYALHMPLASNLSSRAVKNIHLISGCRYAKQVNDGNPTPPTAQTSTKTCSWCSTEDKCFFGLPCRHLCLCQSCSKTKQLCTTCHEPVTAYVRIFSP